MPRIAYKYIELGEEFYGNDEPQSHRFLTPTDYLGVANDWSEQIKNYFPDVKIAVVGATTDRTQDGGSRRNTWNNAFASFISGNTIYFDAITFHNYPDLNLGPCDPGDDCHCNYATKQEVVDHILARPFESFDDYENDAIICPSELATSETQPEFSLLDNNSNSTVDAGDFEGWITEYNLNEKDYKLDGTWAQTLFVAAQSLRALENPWISHETVFSLLNGPGSGVYFDGDLNYTYNNACAEESVTPWNLAPIGYATKFLAEAARNCYYAAKIDFTTAAPMIVSPDDCNYSGLYGWLFTNNTSGNFTSIDNNYAVILNLTDGEQDVDISALMIAGSYEQMTLYNYTSTEDIATLITTDNTEIEISSPVWTSGDVPLPPYSITLVKNLTSYLSYLPFPQHPHIEVSNTTTCVGGDVTFYVSGCFSYLLGSSNGGSLIFSGNSVTVNPTTNTEYYVAGYDPVYQLLYDMQTFEISVSPTVSNLVVSQSPIGPVCPGTQIDLEASPTYSLLVPLDFIWSPGSLDDLSTGSTITVTATGDATSSQYYLVATDGTCYCSETHFEPSVIPPADAGPDVVVCSTPAPVDAYIGTDDGYPPFTTFTWTPSSELNNGAWQKPYLDNGAYPINTNTYTLEVTLPVAYNCTLNTDEMTVMAIANCCLNTPYLIPYQTTATSPTYSSYPNAYDLVYSIDPNLINDVGSDDLTSLLGYLNDEAHVTLTTALTINGPFYVNLNLFLEGCTDLEFGPEAAIIIEPNCQLVIDGSTLKAGCNYMWNGIVIDGNMHLDENNNWNDGLQIINGSTIQDAITAVSASNDSHLSILGTNLVMNTFQYNHTHLSIHGYPDLVSGKIEYNNFTGPDYGTLMLDPYLGEKTLQAINYSDLATSGFAINRNQISYAETGIYGSKSGFSIIDNDPIDNCGIGIDIEKPKGPMLIQKNVITTDANINSDGAGIKVLSIGAATVTIGGEDTNDKNTINSNSTDGIYIDGAEGVRVIGNTINVHEDNSASTAVYGIRTTNSANAFIKLNEIDGGSGSYDFKRGIYISEGSGTQLYCNTINQVERGLEFIGSNNNISTGDNTFNIMDLGFILGDEGITTSTLNDQQYDATHTCGNHFNGDGYGNFGTGGYALYTIDYNNTSAAVNYFMLPCDYNPPYASIAAVPNYNEYLGYGGAGQSFAPQPPGSGVNNCIVCDDLPEFAGTSQFDLQLDLAFIRNDLSFVSEQQECYLWELKYELYSRLHDFPEYRESNDTLSNFYDSCQANNYKIFYTIDSLKSLILEETISNSEKQALCEAAQSENNRIDPYGDYESNLQIVNDIFLRTVDIDTFTEGQIDTLILISNQCPYEKGHGVFIARELITSVVDTISFNDNLLCNVAPRILDNTTEMNQFNVYPNPFNESITIEYSTTDSSKHSIQISDVLGRIVFETVLRELIGKILLDLSNLPSEVYLATLLSGNQILRSAKIIRTK